jgi:hypothetical protein
VRSASVSAAQPRGEIAQPLLVHYKLQPMRAVRGQVITTRLEPLMFSFQGDMFGLKHREFGGHC